MANVGSAATCSVSGRVGRSLIGSTVTSHDSRGGNVPFGLASRLGEALSNLSESGNQRQGGQNQNLGGDQRLFAGVHRQKGTRSLADILQILSATLFEKSR
jgi:hypothetical protein